MHTHTLCSWEETNTLVEYLVIFRCIWSPLEATEKLETILETFSLILNILTHIIQTTC